MLKRPTVWEFDAGLRVRGPRLPRGASEQDVRRACRHVKRTISDTPPAHAQFKAELRRASGRMSTQPEHYALAHVPQMFKSCEMRLPHLEERRYSQHCWIDILTLWTGAWQRPGPRGTAHRHKACHQRTRRLIDQAGLLGRAPKRSQQRGRLDPRGDAPAWCPRRAAAQSPNAPGAQGLQ